VYAVIDYGAELGVLHTLALADAEPVDEILLYELKVIQLEVGLVGPGTESLENLSRFSKAAVVVIVCHNNPNQRMMK
jgi:hypothetical protein